MKKKLVALMLSAVMAVSVLAGCGGSNAGGTTDQAAATDTAEAAEDGTGETKTIKIGYSQANAGDAFRSSWLKSFSAKTDAKGYTLVTTDASDDISKQISDVENLILQGCDVICVNGLDTEAIIPALEAVKAAGIPCVMVDTDVADENLFDCSISENALTVGRIQGEYIKNWIEERNVDLKLGYIVGMYAMTTTYGRRDGVYEVLGIDKATVENEGMWKANDAMSLAEDWLQAYPDLNVIACMNDDMAIGVIQAYNAAGVNMDDVLIIGIDGLEAGAGYIKEGTLDATVGRDLDKETSMYLDVCEKLAAGEQVEKKIDPDSSFILDASNVYEYYPD